MTDILQKLRSLTESRPADSEILAEAMAEIAELRKRRDSLEEILIILARTEIPWDEDGKVTEAFPHFQERYHNAIHEAADLLGLDIRSRITRTEPRT